MASEDSDVQKDIRPFFISYLLIPTIVYILR